MGQSRSSETAPPLPMTDIPESHNPTLEAAPLVSPTTDNPQIQNITNEENHHESNLVLCIIMGILTDWPWKIAAYISGNSKSKEYSYFSHLQWFSVAIRFLLTIMGLIVKELTCFHRDRLDQNIIQQNNGSKEVKCDETSQIFSDIVVPDIIILFALTWLLLQKSFGKFHNLCRSMESADKGIIDLVSRIESQKEPDIYMRILFPVLFLGYVILSQGVSIMNMYAFDIEGSDVTIHGKWTSISGSKKTMLIAMSFLGFVAYDLFYTQLIMRYTFECKMNIYFLEEIQKKVNKSVQNDAENENYAYKNHSEALNDVENAHNFLMQLNRNTTIVKFIIIITIFLATNCVDSLVNEGNTIFQEAALTARFLQWSFLIIFPLYQAAQVNQASITLRETGLAIYRPLVRFENNTCHENKMIWKHASPIALKAKLFGFTIQPLFPYLIIILIILTLFSLMVVSGYKINGRNHCYNICSGLTVVHL